MASSAWIDVLLWLDSLVMESILICDRSLKSEIDFYRVPTDNGKL